HRVTARTLLVEGEAAARNEHLAAEGLDRCMPNRERVTIPGAGRALDPDHADAFNQAVLRFFDRPGPPLENADEKP
ncbi:MAG TPA: hypothetical protein VI792_02570, partial [Candidatus Eisenbacteria bacterium]